MSIILDIRTPKEYQTWHLPNAILIPTKLPPLNSCDVYNMGTILERKLKTAHRNRSIIVYCKKGIRSSVAKQLLECIGFKSVTNIGGVETSPLKYLKAHQTNF